MPKSKLTTREERSLKHTLENIDYTCGSLITMGMKYDMNNINAEDLMINLVLKLQVLLIVCKAVFYCQNMLYVGLLTFSLL